MRSARARSTNRAGLPSGRTGTYRTLADYNAELKTLADQNPGLVKLITLKNKTLSGRRTSWASRSPGRQRRGRQARAS